MAATLAELQQREHEAVATFLAAKHGTEEEIDAVVNLSGIHFMVQEALDQEPQPATVLIQDGLTGEPTEWEVSNEEPGLD